MKSKARPESAKRGLRPWKKGQSGNPSGRPPLAKTIPDLLRWAGALNAPETVVAKMRAVFGIPHGTALTVDQACVLRSRMEALNGDVRHLAFWAERAEGKVTDKLEIAGVKLQVVEQIVDTPQQKPAQLTDRHEREP